MDMFATNIWFIAYEFLTVLVGALIAFGIAFIITREKYSLGHIAKLLVFCAYLAAVFHVTGSGTFFEALQGVSEAERAIGFIPFAEYSWYMLYILNIVMLIPFGFLLPLIWEKAQKLWFVALHGFLLSFIIEASQLLNYRATDVDDLLTNTLGAIIGYGLYNFFASRSKKERKKTAHKSTEPLLYITFMFFGYFFLYNQMYFVNLL